MISFRYLMQWMRQFSQFTYEGIAHSGRGHFIARGHGSICYMETSLIHSLLISISSFTKSLQLATSNF